MIVNYCEQGWQMITQRSHGLLAAQICAHWRKDKQPLRWVETLIATAEHDDQNDDLTHPELIDENGGPKNFKMVVFDRAYCDRLLDNALTKGRYIGLLTSMHIRFLFSGQPSAKAYCASLAKKEKSWIKQAGTSLEQVKASYELLEFCDAFSLIICQQLVPPESRSMDISCGPDGTIYQLCTGNNDELIVTPWPFEESSFQVNYESRTIEQLAFKSRSALQKKLASAEITLHTITICRADKQ